MAVDFSNEKDIQKASIALRKKHDALDWSAKVDDLIRLEGLSQGRWHPTRDKWSLARLVQAAKKKVKALISVKDQVILLSDDIHHAKEAFAKGHELGHSTLPWHREVLYICDEHDLAADTRAQMEWEANTFSREVLLPVPLLQQAYEKYETSMDTVLLISGWSGASIESTAIAYAKNHPGKCVLLTMKDGYNKSTGERHLESIHKVVSPKAAKSPLGALLKEQVFPNNHVLFTSSRGSGTSKTRLHFDSAPNKHYAVSVMNNSYRVFALIFEE